MREWRRMNSRIVGSVALVLAAVVPFVKELGATRWICAGGLGLIVLATLAREVLHARETTRRADQTVNRLLLCPPRPVRDANPYVLGVSHSEIADRFDLGDGPPYVSRDVDAELDRCLVRGVFTILVGPSKAGKSRTAFEAIRRNCGDRELIAFSSTALRGQTLAPLLDEAISATTQDKVIWLDGLYDFLRTGALTLPVLNGWLARAPELIVISTLRSHDLSELRGTSPDGIGAEFHQILDRAAMIPLMPNLTASETKQAAEAYPGESFDDGLGVHLVAGPRLVERYVEAVGTCPEGHAVVTAAVDRYRVGIVESTSTDDIRALAEGYWSVLRPHTEFTDEVFRRGLAWAASPVLSDVALLLKVPGEDDYQPFDYVTAFLDGEVGRGVGHASIPDATWQWALRKAQEDDLEAVGFSALVHDNHEISVAAFTALGRSDDPELAARGTLNVGHLAVVVGRDDLAKMMFTVVLSERFDSSMYEAAYNLGLLCTADDPDLAEMAYRIAFEGPLDTFGARAAVNLGLLLREQAHAGSVRIGDADASGVGFGPSEPDDAALAIDEEARGLFSAAIESNDREAVQNAGNALGVLEWMQGDFDAAEAAFLDAADNGGIQAAANCARMLGELDDGRPEAFELLRRGRELAEQDGSGRFDLELDQTEAVLAFLAGDSRRAEELFTSIRERTADALGSQHDYAHATWGLVEIYSSNAPARVDPLLVELTQLGVEPYAAAADERLLL